MIDWKQWTTRIGWALSVALLVTLLCLYVAWGNSKSYELISGPQSSTRYTFTRTKNLLNQYKQIRGVFPKSLSQLDDYAALQEHGELQDGWKRPIEYSTDGNDFLLTSRGADGVIGGIGNNHDLTNKNPRPSQSALTFTQWWNEPAALGIRNTCFFGGVWALLVLMIAGGKDDKQKKKVSLLESIVAVLLLMVIVIPITAFMSLLHLPSGH